MSTLTGVAASVADLGPEWDALFEAGPGLQSRREWFAATEAAALPDGSAPHWVTVHDAGRPLALLPLRCGPGAAVSSLTSPYTVQFQPLLAPPADADADAGAGAAGLALGKYLRRWPVVTLEALDPAWPCLAPLLAGMRRGGMLAWPFDHFGNWTEGVAGLDWPGYLAGRPGTLRETVRRRGRAAAKDKAIRFEVVRGAEGLDAAIEAYEAVYARSWKVPEPFPAFNAALLPRVAALGALRLGVLWQGTQPLAAQYWTVLDGVATVLKLAHDDAAKALSPGTLLTAHMIQSLLGERPATLDFGRGDDPYKQLWTGTRRQRTGVVLANPRTPAGLAAIGRHWAGSAARRLRRRA